MNCMFFTKIHYKNKFLFELEVLIQKEMTFAEINQ